MTEPLSIISATTVLTALAQNLASQLSTFISAFPDAPEDTHHAPEELSSLCQILGQLETVLIDDPTSSSPFPPEVIEALRTVLDRCIEIFEKFLDFIQAVDRGDWGLSENQVGAFRRELEAHRATLSIAVQLGTILATHQAPTTPTTPSSSSTSPSSSSRPKTLETLFQRFIARTGANPPISTSNEALLSYMSLLSSSTLPSTPPSSPPPNDDLYTASSRGNLSEVQALLASGISANSRCTSWRNRTALQAAATENHREVVQLLLQHGADVHTRDSNNVTPLQAAARSGNYECVQLLLKAGADVNEAPGMDGTALEAAKESKCLVLVKLLMDTGAKSWKGGKVKERMWRGLMSSRG